MKFGRYWMACISHARPANVQPLEHRTGVKWTFYTGSESDEVAAYKSQTAAVIPSGKLCPSRNRALDDAFDQGLICVQISDDFTQASILRAAPERAAKCTADNVTFLQAFARLASGFEGSAYNLAGICSTTMNSPGYLSNPIANYMFVLGDMMIIKPNDIRFDESLSLKEDYDHTLQHIRRFHGIYRDNLIRMNFQHKTNFGGAVAYRTTKLELETIEKLTARWGELIRVNPRRKNEILLNYSKVKRLLKADA
jgi:hypothetical protein